MINWKQEMIWLTILYRMLECKEEMPVITNGTAYEFIDNELQELAAKELIAIDSVFRKLSINTRGLTKKLVSFFIIGNDITTSNAIANKSIIIST